MKVLLEQTRQYAAQLYNTNMQLIAGEAAAQETAECEDPIDCAWLQQAPPVIPSRWHPGTSIGRLRQADLERDCTVRCKAIAS